MLDDIMYAHRYAVQAGEDAIKNEELIRIWIAALDARDCCKLPTEST